MLKILMIVASSTELAANALEQAKIERNLKDEIAMVFESVDQFFQHCHTHLGGSSGLTILENIELANRNTGDGMFAVFHNPYATNPPSSYPFELQTVIPTVIIVNDEGHMSYHDATVVDAVNQTPTPLVDDDMREIRTHLTDAAACSVRIFAGDVPGKAGANNVYFVNGFNLKQNPEAISCIAGALFREPSQAIVFQTGFPHDGKFNGITLETLFAIAADRLAGFQAGPYACSQNQIALDHAKSAIAALQRRTEKRVELGVHESTINHETMVDVEAVDDIIDFDAEQTNALQALEGTTWSEFKVSDHLNSSDEIIDFLILAIEEENLPGGKNTIRNANEARARLKESATPIDTYNSMAADIRGSNFNPKHVGSSFDSFLEEEGILEECNDEAKIRVADWQVEQSNKV